MLKLKTSILLFYSLFFLSVANNFGQVTTASVSGEVRDNEKAILPGATVIAQHKPSGTQYGTVSLENGRFNLPGVQRRCDQLYQFA